MTTQLPQLVINPNALSPEHLLLRVLSCEPTCPTTRTEAIRRILRRYPDFTRFGDDPENPRDSAVRAWERLRRDTKYARFVEIGANRGLILTGIGETRLDELWNREVVGPNLSRIQHEYGEEIARAVAERERR